LVNTLLYNEDPRPAEVIIEKRWQRDSWKLADAAEKMTESSGVDSFQLGLRDVTRVLYGRL
jgi:hypothetical protein